MENKIKHIFIDANIFLDFYRLSEKDINELRKILDLIKNGSIKIYLNEQVKQEFYRRREEVFSETFKEISKIHPDSSLVVLFKKNNLLQKYEHYRVLKKAKQVIEKIKSELIDDLQRDIVGYNLTADSLIKDIFESVTLFESNIYLEKAILRMNLGNPPGKKHSYGDAINWEFLLDKVDDKEDLIIISRDGDYKSEIDGAKIKPFLLEEWKIKKGSKIYLYDSLTNFFDKHDIEIELEERKYKDELIEKLMNSPNFLTTHSIISRLNSFKYFEDYQIKKIAFALLNNSQVSWIFDDIDIKNFYKKVLSSDRMDLFSDEEISQLDAYLKVSNNQINEELDNVINQISSSKEDEIDINDIPF